MAEDRWECEFVKFVDELQMAGLTARDPQRRRAFAHRYAKELAYVALYLNDLGVTGGEAEFRPDSPESCDLCGAALERWGFFIDGAVASGEWADMCPDCYADRGSGIGWGIGQLYRARPNGQWRCVAGGNPEPASNADPV